MIGAPSEGRLEDLLGALLDETDVEMVVASEPGLRGESVDAFVNRQFQEWQVGGRSAGGRGLLLLFAVPEREVRLEVGYALEGIFTDAFVSYVEHEQMAPYFADGRIGEGIEATTELVAGRAFERIVGADPTAGDGRVGGFRSGGAGVRTAVEIGGGRKAEAADAPTRERFAAQPTPEAAWARFLELNRRRLKDPDLGIYDAAARRIMGGTVTNAGQDHIARLYRGKRYEVRRLGERAAIVFPDDPDYRLAPWFFHRGAAGWQIDGSMYPDVIGYNHRNQWHFKRLDHPYMFAFEDYDFDSHGFARRRHSE